MKIKRNGSEAQVAKEKVKVNAEEAIELNSRTGWPIQVEVASIL